MHHVDPDHWSDLVARFAPDPVPYGRTSCGSAAPASRLTTDSSLVSCASCLRMLPEEATGFGEPSADTVWLTTIEAAAHLGVDRSALDSRAAEACQRLPQVVIQVGAGDERASYRWNRDRLAEVFAPEPATRPKRSGRSLRSIVGS